MNLSRIYAGAIRLSHSVRLYVPSKIGKRAVKNMQAGQVKAVAAAMSKRWGGATAYDAAGMWVSDRDGLVAEDIVIVESHAQKLVAADLKYLKVLADQVKATMRQEMLSVEIDGELLLV